ncbi:MAG: DUF2252 family protein, partial [Actinomycetota bacterium]
LVTLEHRASVGGQAVEVLVECLHHHGARLCGHFLARAHARSGDAVAISSYMGESTNFEAAIADFSLIYADLVAHDFELFQEAVASGRLMGGSASEQMDDYLEAFRNPAAYPVQ